MSNHYYAIQSTKYLSYKILVVTKWFGITIWKSFYREFNKETMTYNDINWLGKKDVFEKIKILESKNQYILINNKDNQ